MVLQTKITNCKKDTEKLDNIFFWALNIRVIAMTTSRQLFVHVHVLTITSSEKTFLRDFSKNTKQTLQSFENILSKSYIL